MNKSSYVKFFVWLFLSFTAMVYMVQMPQRPSMLLVYVVMFFIFWPVFNWLLLAGSEDKGSMLEAIKPVIDSMELDELEALDDYIDAELLKRGNKK
jgi:hypothetical protein